MALATAHRYLQRRTCRICGTGFEVPARDGPGRRLEMCDGCRASQAARTKRNHRAKHPDRNRARDAVKAAIASGRLTRQSCERCAEPNAHAHHPDYAEPLRIVWLCRTCHGQEHSRLRREAKEIA